MTREGFDELIRRLEGVSRRSPGLYRARLVALVALAYAYLILALLGSLVLCAAMIGLVIAAPAAIKLAIIGIFAFGGIFVAVLRGLWVKLEPPKGEIVTRSQAPMLFKLLDEVREALDCKPFHEVAIVGEVNAGVVQIPRLGILGWHRNHLVLGLPLMQMLAPEEFKAVLAHEFAHSSRGHGRFGNWLYRVRRTWEQVFREMAKQRSRLGFVLFRFVNWYWPVFNGHAFVLARANEYEADACSVRLAGAAASARALTRMRVNCAMLAEKFWPETFARANELAEPPANVLTELDRALKRGPGPEDSARWLRQAFLIETNNADTHPCLKDRLRAMGQLPAEIEAGRFPETPPAAPPQSAADYYLGEHAVTVARKMSDDWREKVVTSWKDRHAKAQKIASELAVESPAGAPPTVAEAWQKASKIVDLRGDAVAVAALQTVLELEPKHAAAHFILGRHYLQADDARGVKHMESAICFDPSLTQAGCNLLFAHFNRTGQRDKLRPLENRFDEFQKRTAIAQQERARLTAADIFLPHGLTAAQAEELKKALAEEPDIRRAAVARKKVLHFPESACFGVAIEIGTSWWKPRSSSANRQLVQRLVKKIKLPGYFIVFVAEKNLKKVGKKVFAAPGCVVYERAGR
jgi:Zn-dependent protease with chaperone function